MSASECSLLSCSSHPVWLEQQQRPGSRLTLAPQSGRCRFLDVGDSDMRACGLRLTDGACWPPPRIAWPLITDLRGSIDVHRRAITATSTGMAFRSGASPAGCGRRVTAVYRNVVRASTTVPWYKPLAASASAKPFVVVQGNVYVFDASGTLW